MSKPKNTGKRTTTYAVLKEEYEEMMAKQQKEFDKLKELMAATEKQLEHERNARIEEKAEMEGKDIDPTVGKISDITEITGGTRMEQLKLNEGRKVNLTSYVYDDLFAHVKFLSDESFAASPKILERAMQKMGVEEEWDKLQHSEDTKKEIRVALTHRRSYCKGKVFEKFRGKCNLIVVCQLSFLYTNICWLVCIVP